tara:strand:- start:1392 stop:1712 length:321 start_codon:yes stop_codon:yes gene_type:complete
MSHLLILIILFTNWNTIINSSTYIDSINQKVELKKEVYFILNTKCNFCHAKKKNRVIFTLDNMNSFSTSIEQQVFINKKMPKGRKNKLNMAEEEKLNIWINSLDNP